MPDPAYTHAHPVNPVSVAQLAAEILTDRAESCALYDRLMRGPQRVSMAEALTMVVTGDAPTARAGIGRLRETLINAALEVARQRLADRFGAPPQDVHVDWDRSPQEVPA